MTNDVLQQLHSAQVFKLLRGVMGNASSPKDLVNTTGLFKASGGRFLGNSSSWYSRIGSVRSTKRGCSQGEEFASAEIALYRDTRHEKLNSEKHVTK